MTSAELIPRITVTDIVDQRNRAVKSYRAAYQTLVTASEALDEARLEAEKASPGVTRYNHQSDRDRRLFLNRLEVPPEDDFMGEAIRLTDIDAWSYIIKMTPLEKLMDKKAKDELHAQLIENPAELTVDTVMATVESFALDADEIFKRGIAECFSNLDRRFKSHDGWKIGSRVILNGAFDERGYWNYHRNHRDTLHDIERTFMILDDKEPPETWAGIIKAVDDSRSQRSGARQSEVETDYFKIRCFQNGNCHVWFTRDDLLRKVNKLLGEYYGDAIPEERDADPDDGLHDKKTTPAKNFGFFPTPDDLADDVIRRVSLYRRSDDPRLVVLEPSAGTGALASRAVSDDTTVDCVEVQPHLAAALRSAGLYRTVTQVDFLSLRPRAIYDRVIMNPPFDRERDIDHVMHAMKFLKPDGELVAIMSAGTTFRETKKSTAFRALLKKNSGFWIDLPPRSFASVGTNVNVVLVAIRLDGRRPYF